MLRVAMLSKWHVHARDYAKAVQESDRAVITVVWDEDRQQGIEWAKELNCDYEPDLDALLAREDVDAVICDTPTTQHKEVLLKAAKAGKHIFTEKVLDTTLHGAKEIGRAIEDAGVTFTISFPLLSSPLIKLVKQMLADGTFGDVSFARFRRAHDGQISNWLPGYWYDEKESGGGALMDLGCHGYYIANHLFGEPKRVACLMNNLFDSPVDESATTSIEFENGVVFNAETGFITRSNQDMLEIHGSKAILFSWGDELRLRGSESMEFTTPTLPEADPSPIETFINACVDGTGTPSQFGLEAAYTLSYLMEESYKSDSKDKIIQL